jgi:hypothetical protein
MKKVICNREHECDHHPCDHRIPHEGDGPGCDMLIGGASALCQQTKMKSICVPITDGRYISSAIVRCDCGNPKCYGQWTEDSLQQVKETPNE